MKLYSMFLPVAFLLTSQFTSQTFDPGLDWRTIETEHFHIHFESRMAEGAQKLAERVEPVYKKITGKFQWEPWEKTHVVLTDHTDVTNGLSTPLPYDTVYLYAAPPTEDSALDTYDDWINTIFTHEFTHTVHLDMARGLPKLLRYVVGRLMIPNATQPQWGIEGLAVYEETFETSAGRGRSPFVQMYLRTAALEDHFLSIDHGTYWNDVYPYGNAAYWYGIGFYIYLKEKYGEEKIVELVNEFSRWPIPAFLNFKTRNVLGKSFTRIWDEWREDEKKKAEAFQKAYEPRYQTEWLNPKEKFSQTGLGVFSEDGKTLYLPTFRDKEAKLLALDLDENFEVKKTHVLKKGIAPGRMFRHQHYLLYSKVGESGPYTTHYDLFSYNLESKTEKQLTRGLRLKDPVVEDEGHLLAVRTNQYKTTIVRVPLSKPIADLDKAEPLRDESKLETLFAAENYSTISSLALSPDKKSMVFTMRIENGFRDLYLMDLATKQVRTLTHDQAEDHDPVFTADGKKIVFASSHDLPQLAEAVPNLFDYNLAEQKIERLTDVRTGAEFPTLSPDQKKVIFGLFTSEGYEPAVLDLDQVQHWNFEPFKGVKVETKHASVTTPSPTPTPVTASAPESHPYQLGNTLLPRYLLPLFLYTESDTLLGAVTSSNDPLYFHNWSALGFYLLGPARPGGAFGYTYSGFRHITLFSGGSAGITNYGQILVKASTSGSGFAVVPEDYYERDYYGYVGYGYQFLSDGLPSKFTLSQFYFVEKREALLGFPAGTLSGTQTLTAGSRVIPNVQMRPEEGLDHGISTTLTYRTEASQKVDDISPDRGSLASLKVDYTFKGAGSDFETLTSILSGKTYYQFTDGQFLAASFNSGLQWLKPLYQRSFRLGGSIGEGPISAASHRSYPLRGLPSSALQGEGIFTGSLEYRFLLLEHLPGFGTAPVWFKNLHAALFTDGGQTFKWKETKTLVEVLSRNELQNFKGNRFTESVGAELRSDISTTYLPPITFRAGYGYVLFLEGDWIAKRRIDEVYFQIGPSF